MRYDEALIRIAESVEWLRGELEETKRQLRNVVRPGVVEDVDPAKYRVKMKLGDPDSKDALETDWVPWAEAAGPAKHGKTWFPPKKGQIMYLVSPSGEPGLGLALHTTFTDDNSAPSNKGDENVIEFGKARVTWRDDKLLLEQDGSSIELTKDKIVLKAGGSEIEIKSGHINQIADAIHAVGETHLGVDVRDQPAGPKVVTTSGPARKTYAKV